jgi:hypothetical protein
LNLPRFSGHTEKLNVMFDKEVCPCLGINPVERMTKNSNVKPSG